MTEDEQPRARKPAPPRDRSGDESLRGRARRAAYFAWLRSDAKGRLHPGAWSRGVRAKVHLRPIAAEDDDPGGRAPKGELRAEALGSDKVEFFPAKDPSPNVSFGCLQRFVRVDGALRLEDTVIKLAVTPEEARTVDPASIRVFRYDERLDRPLLVERSGIGADGSYVWARISRPGTYGLYGLPRDQATLITANLSCLIRRSGPALAAAGVKGPLVMDRICHLILCNDQLRASGLLDDPSRLDAIGMGDAVGIPELLYGGDLEDLPRGDKGRPVGAPKEYVPKPGFGGPGDGPPGWRRPAGNICDQCLGRQVPDVITPGEWDPPECQILEAPTPVDKPEGGYVIPKPAPEVWRSIGPTNVAGRVKSLAWSASHPDIVYAGAAEGGVWKSTDGGRSWEPKMLEELSLSIGSVAVAATDVDIVYAATGEYSPSDVGLSASIYPGVGVYRSADGGESWTLMPPISSRQCSRVLVHPTNPRLVYVAGMNGIDRWDEGSGAWVRISSADATDIAFDPSDPKRLYAGVEGGLAVVTTADAESTGDAGRSWSASNSGLTIPANTHSFVKLAASASSPSVMYALINTEGLDADGNWANSGAAVYRRDGGSWTAKGTPVDGTQDYWAAAIAVSPLDADLVVVAGNSYDGVKHSSDGGDTWTAHAAGHADVHSIVFRPDDPSITLIANDGGVWHHDDDAGQAGYASSNRDLVTTQFFNVSASRSWPDPEPNIDLGNPSPSALGGSTQDQGILKSDGFGTFIGLGGNEGGVFEINPSDGNVIYWDPWDGNLRRTDDGTGAGRRDASNGLAPTSPRALAIAPRDSDVVIAGMYGDSSASPALPPSAYYSNDAASSWKRVVDDTGGTVQRIAFAPSDPSRVYWCVDDGTVWRSDDGGRSWSVVSDASLPAGKLRGLAVDWHDRDTVFVTYAGVGLGFGHVWGSDSAGRSWRDISGRTRRPTWPPPDLRPFRGGRLPDVPFVAIAQHAGRPETLYAAAEPGVFRTTDGGDSWSRFDEALPNAVVSDMDYRAGTGELFVSTIGRGMWQRRV